MRKLVRFLKGERGAGGLASFYVISIIAIILCLVSVAIIRYAMIKSNMKTAANEVLQVMKVENGADYKTHARFDELLKKMNMDPSTVTFTATPKTKQRGDLLEVTATREYNVFPLKMFGDDYNITIVVHTAGLAHKYIREGGP